MSESHKLQIQSFLFKKALDLQETWQALWEYRYSPKSTGYALPHPFSTTCWWEMYQVMIWAKNKNNGF